MQVLEVLLKVCPLFGSPDPALLQISDGSFAPDAILTFDSVKVPERIATVMGMGIE